MSQNKNKKRIKRDKKFRIEAAEGIEGLISGVAGAASGMPAVDPISLAIKAAAITGNAIKSTADLNKEGFYTKDDELALGISSVLNPLGHLKDVMNSDFSTRDKFKAAITGGVGMASIGQEYTNRIREQENIAEGLNRILRTQHIDRNIPTFAFGGENIQNTVDTIRGKSHIDGGVNIGNIVEAEGNETKTDNVIYSDRLTIDKNDIKDYNLPNTYLGKTIADVSKLIENKFSKRAGDSLDNKEKSYKLNELTNIQKIKRFKEMYNKVIELAKSNPNILDSTINGTSNLNNELEMATNENAIKNNTADIAFENTELDHPLLRKRPPTGAYGLELGHPLLRKRPPTASGGFEFDDPPYGELGNYSNASKSGFKLNYSKPNEDNELNIYNSLIKKEKDIYDLFNENVKKFNLSVVKPEDLQKAIVEVNQDALSFGKRTSKNKGIDGTIGFVTANAFNNNTTDVINVLKDYGYNLGNNNNNFESIIPPYKDTLLYKTPIDIISDNEYKEDKKNLINSILRDNGYSDGNSNNSTNLYESIIPPYKDTPLDKIPENKYLKVEHSKVDVDKYKSDYNLDEETDENNSSNNNSNIKDKYGFLKYQGGNIASMIFGIQGLLKDKIRPSFVEPSTINASYLDPTKAIQDSNIAASSMASGISQDALGLGAATAARIALATSAMKGVSNINKEYDNINSQIFNQVNQFNAQMISKANEQNQMEKRYNEDINMKERDNARNMIQSGLSNFAEVRMTKDLDRNANIVQNQVLKFMKERDLKIDMSTGSPEIVPNNSDNLENKDYKAEITNAYGLSIEQLDYLLRTLSY